MKLSKNTLCTHHKNGDHNDNHPENEEILTLSKHTKLHIIQGDYPQTFKPNNKMGSRLRKIPPDSGSSWCSGCQEFLPRRNFRKDRNNWSGLDRFCKQCRSERAKKEKDD